MDGFVSYTNFIVFCRPQIKLFVQGLFDLDNDISLFKEHLRDFLIQIKVRLLFISLLEFLLILRLAILN